MAALIANQSASSNHLPSYIAYQPQCKSSKSTDTNILFNNDKWWQDIPLCMAAIKEAASQIRWFKYFDHHKNVYLPVTAKQISSINISKNQFSDIITMKFYYINTTSDSLKTPIHSTTFKFEPTHTNSNHNNYNYLNYKVNCPLVSFNRHNTPIIYTAIHSFVNELNYMVNQLATIEFPPTSINIYAIYHNSNPNPNPHPAVYPTSTYVSTTRYAYGTTAYHNIYCHNVGYWELQPTYHIGKTPTDSTMFTGAMRYIY